MLDSGLIVEPRDLSLERKSGMTGDPFLQSLNSSDLQIAKESLTNWLPFLTKDLCVGCAASLHDRIQSLSPVKEQNPGDSDANEVGGCVEELGLDFVEECSCVIGGGVEESIGASTDGWENIKSTGWDSDPEPESPKVRMSWADELEEEEFRKRSLEGGMEGGAKEEVSLKKSGLSREQRERIRFTSVVRKKDFVCLGRINGKIVNILEGIELHTGVFSAVEQKRIVDFVSELTVNLMNDKRGDYTISQDTESRNDLRGKGCLTFQFGCHFNYMEQNGNPPGILRESAADPMPNLFKTMIKRLIGWHVMPMSCVPDCCSVDIYEPGDSAPPDIESPDFDRPICSVPLSNECSVSFGVNPRAADAGAEAAGSTAIPVPAGSALVLSGKGANIAKHWVVASPSKRICITFRRMDETKRPIGFELDPYLRGIRPYDSGSCGEKEESYAEVRTVGRRGRRFDRRRSNAGGRNSSKDGVGEIPARSRRDQANNECGRTPGERRVQMEQKRIVITRSLEVDDGGIAGRSPGGYNPPAHPQVQIRTLKNNNQRRVRMNL